jgi:hypothetical protein
MFPGRRSPSLDLLTTVSVTRHDRRRDEIIHVGRMPRTDTFQIGVEVLPRPRDCEPGRQGRHA